MENKCREILFNVRRKAGLFFDIPFNYTILCTMSYLDNDRLKQIGFLLLILFLGILLFMKMFTYFPGFLGAVTL